MKRSLKELTGYAVKAKDGIKGNVIDFLFDEEKWIIGYLEADLGTIFSGRKVLIPKIFLKEPEWSSHNFSFCGLAMWRIKKPKLSIITELQRK